MNPEAVVIESASGRSKYELLDAALDEVGFAECLEKVRLTVGKAKKDLLIVIKPNLAMFFGHHATITDPLLVEHLVDRLHGLGYTRIVLGEAQNVYHKWLHNRGIHHIAKEAGYTCPERGQGRYELVDLSQKGELRECRFPETYALFGTRISKHWQDADFRVSFAKNKTHEQYMYSLCLKNLLGVIPEKDKHLHYHCRLKARDVCLELYRHFTVHFNIIDAYESNHGNVGSRVPNPIQTDTIIAGADGILVDWVGAVKMGIDPTLSPLNGKALEKIKLPEHYRVTGSLEPYRGWKNANPAISNLFVRLDEASERKHLFWPASFVVDSKKFPWKKRGLKWKNLISSCLWGTGIDRFPPLRWIMIAISCCRSFCSFLGMAWRTILDKQQLRRRELPINVAEDAFEGRHYEELPDFIRRREEIIEAIPKKKGSCHTFLDDGILYYREQEVDFPFDDFVRKVDICKSLTYMKHYIGGRAVRVRSDSMGRCIYQLERTVFLAQPNCMMLLNGKDIDITKIERIDYREGRRKLIWKTVFSDNRSATFDVGAVTFERVNCRTRIRILAHQDFAMPSMIGNWGRLDRPQGWRRLLMVLVYWCYFRKTTRNYCAVARGDYKPIGRPWIDEEKEEGGGSVKLYPEERHLAWLLRVYTVLFAMGGFLFLLFPQIPHFFTFDPAPHGFLGLIKAIGGALLQLCSTGAHWARAEVTIPERFWVFSFFAMMLTISAGCYIASLDVRRYRKLVIPVLVEKIFAALSGLAYFMFWSEQGIVWFRWDYHYFPFLMVFLIDFPLFVLLLILYLRAQTGAVPETYSRSRVDRRNYTPMLVGKDNTIVSIVNRGEGKKFEALDQVIKEAQFFEVLDKYRKQKKKEKEDFRIVIKPNFMMTYHKKDYTTYTDPELVECLVHRIHGQGYRNVTMVESQNCYGTYFLNREVISVARYVGYDVNAKGENPDDLYNMVDITEEKVPYPYGGPLGDHYVSPTWRDADFRISFAKNKTHSFCYFTLTIKNIYGTLPEQNKYLEYHKKREFDWPTIESLKHFPVHFGFIDAWISADGQMGVIADVTPEKTRTIIGGEKLVAVDHAAAKLMGLYPYDSRFHAMAVEAFGDPESGNVIIVKNIDKYEDWENVNKLLPEILDVAEEAPWIFSHFFMSVFIYADPEAFPLKIKSKIIRWLRQSPIIEWLIAQLFATHRKPYKDKHRELFPDWYPGGVKYEENREYK